MCAVCAVQLADVLSVLPTQLTLVCQHNWTELSGRGTHS